MNRDINKSDIFKLLFYSFLVIWWWRSVWSIMDNVFMYVSRGKKEMLYLFDILSVFIIIGVLCFLPDLRDSF